MAAEYSEPLGLDGKLTPEEQDRLQKHVAGFLTNTCPVCRTTAFTISDRVYAAPMLGLDRQINTAHILPIIAVTCQNCGFVLPFSARALGLYKPLPEKDDG